MKQQILSHLHVIKSSCELELHFHITIPNQAKVPSATKPLRGHQILHCIPAVLVVDYTQKEEVEGQRICRVILNIILNVGVYTGVCVGTCHWTVLGLCAYDK